MFEKEAECYAFDEVNHKQEWYIKHPEHSIDCDYEDIKKHWGKGAEFGYNKANEWHDLRKDPNDLPIFETELLCQKYSGRCFVGYYHYNDNKFYPYEKGNSYDVTDVIAWKEIVLPELPKGE